MKSEWKLKQLDGTNWLEINGKECQITLEERPAYCDRGSVICKLFPEGELLLSIDGQDAWPRYYFDLERAKLECEAWMKKRNQLIGNVGLKPT